MTCPLRPAHNPLPNPNLVTDVPAIFGSASAKVAISTISGRNSPPTLVPLTVSTEKMSIGIRSQASRLRRRPFRIAGQLFWAMMNKLTPARRVLSLIALVFLAVSGMHVDIGQQVHSEINLELFAAILFLLLLSLELADKVIMKRDLEIAREIQTRLVPSEPPAILNAETAFWTRPQNSVAGDDDDAF